MDQIGVFTPEQARELWQDYQSRKQLNPQVSKNYPERRPIDEVSPHRVFVKNTSGETCPAYGCLQITGVEIVGGLFPGDEVVTRGAYALSFAGKGNTSLKEALDAAHGHPHNEDGTEMTKEQLAAAGESGGDGHGHEHGAGSPLTLFLAITCGVLFVLLLASPFVFRGRRAASAE
jgi:hypothetical protein